MNILVVSGTFHPRKFGGITAVSFNVSKKMVELGHDVTVYTTDLGNYPNSRLKVHNVENYGGMEIHYFRNLSNYLAFKHRLFLPIQMLLKLRKNSNQFDIIHLHDFRSLLSIIVHHYAKKYRIPYVLQAHGSVPYLSQKEFFKKVFDKYWGYNLLNDASKIIALTETELEQYYQMGVPKYKIETIPNGIDLSEYHHLPPRGEFREKYGIKIDEKVILFLGRIDKIKGVDLLINSFSEISKELDTVKLVMVGPDEGFLNHIKKIVVDQKISDKVIFTGPLYKKDKLASYVDADVYVLPSRYETFPNTVLEACVCGTPVIVTNNCGISDLVNNKVGYVVDFDINKLKDTIIKLLNDEDQKTKFGDKAKILVKENFDWNNISKKIEAVYISILNSLS